MIKYGSDSIDVYNDIDGFHRTNGPARIYRDGDHYWYLFDRWHRYYGPSTYGDTWWLHGEFIKK